MKIKHNVYIRFKNEVDELEIIAFFKRFHSHVSTFDGSFNFRYAQNTTLQSHLRTYNWLMKWDFVDEKARRDFLDHPDTKAVTGSGIHLVDNPPQGPMLELSDITKPSGICVFDEIVPTSPRILRKAIEKIDTSTVTRELITEMRNSAKFYNDKIYKVKIPGLMQFAFDDKSDIEWLSNQADDFEKILNSLNPEKFPTTKNTSGFV